MSFVFFIAKRSGCFAISDQPTLNEATLARLTHGHTVVQGHFAYHIGVRLETWRIYLVILTYILFGPDDLCTMSLVVCYHFG